jgi:tetratricopeptide (TPR) repeat protein
MRPSVACIDHLAVGDWSYFSMGRLLGEAAALNGDYPAARAAYAQALESATRVEFRPELALTRVELAEVLLQEADHAGALEQLDAAIPALREMGMRPALERALSLTQRVNRRSD